MKAESRRYFNGYEAELMRKAKECMKRSSFVSARRYLDALHALRKKFFGPNHPATAKALYYLAYCQHRMERNQDAEVKYIEALKGYAEALRSKRFKPRLLVKSAISCFKHFSLLLGKKRTKEAIAIAKLFGREKKTMIHFVEHQLADLLDAAAARARERQAKAEADKAESQRAMEARVKAIANAEAEAQETAVAEAAAADSGEAEQLQSADAPASEVTVQESDDDAVSAQQVRVSVVPGREFGGPGIYPALGWLRE